MADRPNEKVEEIASPALAEAMATEVLPVAATNAETARLLRAPDAHVLGRHAESPAGIAWPGWKAVLRRTVLEMLTDRVSLTAAGCAFYGTLALFPAISMLISIYGLLFNPQTVLPQLEVMQDLLPPAAYQLISQRIELLVSRPTGTLTLGLVFSTLVALYLSAAGAKSIIGALNLAYEEHERRSFLRYQLVAFGITLCVILCTALGISFLVALPPALTSFGFVSHQRTLISAVSLMLLVAAVLTGLSLLYRFGPCRASARWTWVTPGSLVATLLWVAASALFSVYVSRFASYDTTYGPLATVVVVMMWFYVTAYVILLGAELNAELELQTSRDTTNGIPKPIGRRGAYVADHVAAGKRR